MSDTLVQQAREALRLADGDPRRSAALGSQVLKRAVAASDAAAAAVAERALGLAAIHLQNLDIALRHLRAAVAQGQAARSRELTGEARMTLAFALNRRGRPRLALREIDAALVDLTGVGRARAQAQRGAILHQLGRFDAALASYQMALPMLRRAHDDLWTMRALLNRGLLHGHRHQFAAAETDLREAERLARSLGLGLLEGFVHQNLSEINALRGDIPTALNYLHRAEQRVGLLQPVAGSLLADRSQLLLSVRLAVEAREAAELAVAAFERERRRIAVPEVRLLVAQAASVQGDLETALRQARRAAREFARHQRPQWAAVAHYLVLRTRIADGDKSRVGVGRLERVADALAAAGWPGPALEARLLAARLALERGLRTRGLAQLALASQARHRGPATLRARGWYAQARLRLAAGNRRGASVALRTGLRILDEYRATLGATDLRAHASGHRVELVDLGLRIAMAGGRTARVFAWAEQGRASHLLLRPVRPPDDPVLAAALAELRKIVAEIDQARRASRPVGRLLQRQVIAERRIRDYSRLPRAEAATPPVGPVTSAVLAPAVGADALLEYVVIDGTLHVVSLVDGHLRRHVVGPAGAVRDLVDRIAFTLRRLGRQHADAASRSAAVALLRHSAAVLDATVLGPVSTVVGDRPLVVIPTGPLQSLPWSTLPSCAGRAVTVAPSAALWYAANGLPPAPVDRVEVVGYGLPGATAEAKTIAALYGVDPLLGPQATVTAVTARMNGAGIAHLATHGRLEPQNALFSSLLLADGPLTVYDLERLDRVPRMVVLAACDSGRSVVGAGDELLGISATFLARGAQQVVASVVPIPDVETTPLMIAFHQLVVRGHPAPRALAEAQRRIAADGGAAMAAAAGFVCIGAAYTLSHA
ncbi:CHAT domain-containing protein [Phytohabitans aurantiacus]|uniref:CHAT domain-containing protein n=1 Tax=Phytohabitans aurantiacus TaxID=3016789 RepID=A0ABQ5R8I6_9ACTN|nr:CHAT domain-containing tetratricopeptide repeat protein [Phytohabitans aurantiacus]GLI02202.1 CHAT domain-containing protein [Phytohabitans aurantiacus]